MAFRVGIDRRGLTSCRETMLPFHAVLEAIFGARTEKLAIVDGRIVQPGDRIKGARVPQICRSTETTVVLCDDHDQLRRLALVSRSE